ncbi:tyrosine-type recombinase/integrase [Ensifer sp. ENS12]|uniref:tyrosine-type recombinase/integrase n=1 Tax=Ensifer sp. ENS12 TaxID=2854774 RepID=UPI001C45354A|nr:tyrosine-type recombinase/integrase [Ensifer sp. ENS12]MBV7522117.1 tyrosine-type recombinase/integrase [Ensifer sp. ENS12]
MQVHHFIAALWVAAEETPYPEGPYFKTLALSGGRPLNVARMRWPDVDLERRAWTFVDGKSELRTAVPLADETVSLLQNLRNARAYQGDFVFSSAHGRLPLRSPTQTVAALRRLGPHLAEESARELGRPWHLYDVRRVVRITLAQFDSPDVADVAVGRGGWNRSLVELGPASCWDRARAALDAWARALKDAAASVKAPQ